ncbi:hypothetical protein [Streptomyces sp. GBA 94-10 4N24]|uniref:hypothetical protein n=1 Tax=Streptomyces sp. GBA 94-10 4N24 TaxID=1218177 RepID=UPI000AF73D61|nr:hypothetical protein [Streptomyces sp. GBA 94-10 4N24]
MAATAVGVSRESHGSYTPAMLALAAACLTCAALFQALGPYRYDATRTARAHLPEPAHPTTRKPGDAPVAPGP